MFLDLLKSFECHWTSIIIPEISLETSIPECWPPQCFFRALFGSCLQPDSFPQKKHPYFLGPQVALILDTCKGICSSLNILTALTVQHSQVFSFPRKQGAESLRFPYWWLNSFWASLGWVPERTCSDSLLKALTRSIHALGCECRLSKVQVYKPGLYRQQTPCSGCLGLKAIHRPGKRAVGMQWRGHPVGSTWIQRLKKSSAVCTHLLHYRNLWHQADTWQVSLSIARVLSLTWDLSWRACRAKHSCLLIEGEFTRCRRKAG